MNFDTDARRRHRARRRLADDADSGRAPPSAVTAPAPIPPRAGGTGALHHFSGGVTRS
jgi:hypothetical protein